MNIFKKILAELPKGKLTVTADNIEDQPVADQYEKMFNYLTAVKFSGKVSCGKTWGDEGENK